MINRLRIGNYALIEKLEIDFISGFITITGETGAGKSILMGALSLILGSRADSGILLSKDKKCIVEGEFTIDDQFKSFFKQHDLDFERDTIIRREILPGGKSRAFINDTPVKIQLLKEIGDQLVDIHSQHQNLQLNDHHYQREVLDFVGKNHADLKQYQELFQLYTKKNRELEELKGKLLQMKDELDFYQFQFDELNAANLAESEKETLESELDQLEHAEDIKHALVHSEEHLQGEMQVLDLLNEMLQMHKKIIGFFPAADGYAERIESAYIDLKDLAREIQLKSDSLDFDPDKMQQMKDRLDLLLNLLQKYKAKEVKELIELKEQLNEKITAITFSDDTIRGLEKEIEEMEKRLFKTAGKLHLNRKETAIYIQKEVSDQLKQLGIPNASFVVKVEKKTLLDQFGADDIRFLFSANKQAAAEEISRVASGGEISRLMLCIKSLLSDYKGLPTLIFDEIDAGVSGEIAEKMGGIMKGLSNDRQVIAITHLPQVAAQGNEHFLVFKEDDETSTVTRIRKLEKDERVIEIAKLLSGEKLSDAAISNARELLRI